MRFRIDDSPDWPGDDGTKDSATTAVAFGIVVPLIIISVVVVNLVLGRVVWPGLGRGSGHRLVLVYSKFWPVAGTVLMKLGMAGILMAWYGLANWVRTERFCWPVAAAAVGAVGVGLIMLFADALF